MTLFQKTPIIFRNEVVGINYVFDCDIEINTEIDGSIYDYSGCGYEKAKQLINDYK